mgnify:FL=1
MRPITYPTLCLLVAALAAPGPATAADYSAGSIKIADPWMPLPPKGSRVAGGYMALTNTGREPDTLVGGTAAIARRLEIHEMTMAGGMMRMRELKPGLVIKPGETVALKPGSYHIMLMDIHEEPRQDRPFKGTLVFEKAGTVEIEYTVEPFGTRAPGDGGQPTTRGGGSGSGSGAAKKVE